MAVRQTGSRAAVYGLKNKVRCSKPDGIVTEVLQVAYRTPLAVKVNVGCLHVVFF